MRVLDLDPVTPINPSALTGTVAAGPLRRVQNSAVLYTADGSDTAQRNLILDLREQIAAQPGSIAGTALGVLAEADAYRSVPAQTPDGTTNLLTPDRLNEAQEQVIQSAMTRRLTVAQGPPGTGKSQLVTALVATATAAGQTALVASTNNRAVDEVRDRTTSTVGPGLIVRTGNKSYQARNPNF
ncbi:MAG TPA: AAA domain-containing protein [Micromonosporaceae bacterium]